MNVNARRETLFRKIENRREDLVRLSDRIHAHPEISFQEHQAVTWLSSAFGDLGWEVEADFGGLPTAFRATHEIGDDGPVIGVLIEYDALPELGHACGHNLKGPAVIGALAAVVDTLSDRSARFAAIGTPAEETGAGKAIMARSGAFEGLDVVLVPSIGPENWAGIATFAGVDAIVRLRGRESHVTYRPEAGRNALDAMLLAFHNISAMRPYLPGEGKIHGVIKEGGSKANTIPGFASAEFIVRASNEGALDRGIAILERCVQAGALASGCEAEVSVGEKYLPMINVPSLNAVILKELKSLGVNAVDVSSRPPFGCADTGNVSQVAPTGYFHVSLGKGLIPHTEEYAQASGSRPGHDALVLLARATAAIVDELLADSSLLQRVTEEYAQIRADR